MAFTCDYCDRDFENSGSGKLHQRNCDLKPENKTYCAECGSVLVGGEKDKFCSRSCAATYNNRGNERSQEVKERIRETLCNRTYEKSECVIRIRECKWCDEAFLTSRDKPDHGYERTTCSDFCLHEVRSEHSKKVAARKRSKNEKLFAEFCKQHFGTVLTNECIFNGWDADVILPDHEVAILWNGRWHYEQITEQHSLKQVQTRDRIKKSEIKNCGYEPYTVKDMGGHDPDFVRREFEEFRNYIAG